MAKVVEALPPQARLILVGDPEQLPPVEVGSVFGELVGDGTNFSPAGAAALFAATGIEWPIGGSAPVLDSVIVLDESFRFATDSGIAALAGALRSGDLEATLAAVDGDFADVENVGQAGQLSLTYEP